MLVTRGAIATFGRAFNGLFKSALLASAAKTQWGIVAMEVPSTTSKNDYGWLNALPRVRKWIGDRIVKRLAASGYSITNDDYELTVGVKRNDFEDDNLGIYTPIAQEMGNSTNAHYDELVFGAMKDGFANPCYDGQPFFDTDHPILDADGNETVFSNFGGGAGEAWFLVPKGTVLKPVILQKRKDFAFVSKDALTDDNVVFQKEFVYGADARHAVGYSLPQLCWGDKNTLDAAHFNTALQAMMEMKADNGQQLGLAEFSLVVGPSNRANGSKIVNSMLIDGGDSNPNYQAATLVVVPWLAA